MIDLARQGFAAYRVGRLLAMDEIARPTRARVNRWAGVNEDGSDNECPDTFRQKVAYLIGCPFCVSVWAAGVVVALDRTRPGRHVVDALAAAGVAALAVSLDD